MSSSCCLFCFADCAHLHFLQQQCYLFSCLFLPLHFHLHSQYVLFNSFLLFTFLHPFICSCDILNSFSSTSLSVRSAWSLDSALLQHFPDSSLYFLIDSSEHYSLSISVMLTFFPVPPLKFHESWDFNGVLTKLMKTLPEPF